MLSIYKPSLLAIMPESILRDPKLRASAAALDVELQRLSAATREVLHLPRLDELSGLILDYLAEQFHVDFYEPLYLSDDVKRALIKDSIAWHRIKGTPAAVEQIANKVFAEAIVREWFEYGGEPYHFKITTKGYKETPDGWATFLRMLDVAKNVRSWLDDITVDYTDELIKDPLIAHAGIAEGWQGGVEIGLNKPDELSIFPARAGMAHAIIGEATISMNPPDILFGNVHRLHAGQALSFGGEIIIGADMRDRPDWRLKIHENPLADLLIADVGLARGGELRYPVATFAETHKTQVFAGGAMLVDGSITVGLPQVPKKTRVRGHVGIGHALTGEVVIKTEPKINLRTWANPRVGQAVVMAGEIVIGSETKPVPVPDVHVFSITDRLRPFAGIGMHIGGACDIGLAPQILHNRAPAQVYTGGLIIIEGEIIIKTTDEPWPDPADFLDGDWLRLYFDYPTGRDHPVLLQNPRGDIYVAEVKAVGDFADENNIFLNSRAEDTISIHRADLIRGFNIAAADDNATLPAADTLRLFFDFATGNKRRIMLHNVRPGITAGELRAIGEDAVGLIKNAYAQTTTGISHVALIKHYKISAANGDTLITF